MTGARGPVTPSPATSANVERIVALVADRSIAEARAEMAAGHGDGVDRFPAQLLGHLFELAGLELAQLLRGRDLIEKGGLRRAQRLTLSFFPQIHTNCRHIRSAPRRQTLSRAVGLFRADSWGSVAGAQRPRRVSPPG